MALIQQTYWPDKWLLSTLTNQVYRTKAEAEAAETEWWNTEKGKTIDSLKQQILGQNTTSKWSGEGFGSAEANAQSMAETLANVGITDISQFGKVPQYSDVKPIAWESMGQKVYLNPGHGYYKFSPVQQGYDDQGNPYFPQQYLTAEEERNVKPTQYGVYAIDPTAEYGTGEYYKPISNDDLVTVDGVLKAKTGEVFGNKATGQALNSDWKVSDPNAFSGTTAGSGFTNFAVQFAPDGTPYFYSYYGGSSSDFGSIAPILGIGASLFAPGLGTALASTLGTSAAVGSALAGGLIGGTLAEAGGGDFLQGALSGGLGSAVGQFTSPAISEAVGGGMLGSAIGQGLTSAALAELQGGDTEQALLMGAIQGAAQGYQNDQLLQQAADADIAGGLIPEYGTNEAYNSFMSSAMTPEAQAAIEANIVGAALGPDNIDVGGGWNPATATPEVNPYDVGGVLGPDNIDIGGGFNPAGQTPSSSTGLLSSNINWGALAKGLIGLLGAGAASSMAQTPSIVPTTTISTYRPADTMPVYSPEYYQQVQQYYNTYLPSTPRDVATPLQEWYSSGYTQPDSVTAKLFSGV